MSTRAAVAVLLALVGCSNEASIQLLFPNAESRAATKQILVYAFKNDDGAFRERCSDLLGRSGRGEPINANPIDNPVDAPFEGRQIAGVQKGALILLVIGFDGGGDAKRPIVEGCTEDFDTGGNSANVPITLAVVTPAAMTTLKLSGDRQVGRPSQVLGVPIVAKVEATIPNVAAQPYPVPGVEFEFVPQERGLVLGDGAAGTARAVRSDGDGRVSTTVTLPPASGRFEIHLLRRGAPAGAEPIVYVVSALAPLAYDGRIESVAVGAGLTRPIAVAVGNVTGAPRPDVVILGCAGTAEECKKGHGTSSPGGGTELVVLRDVLADRGAKADVGRAELGIAPAAVVIDSFVEGGQLDVAVLNSRRTVASGGGRLSEGSEILLFAGEASGLVPVVSPDARVGEPDFTMTASNAVAMVSYRERPGDPLAHLLIAAQGRRLNARRCRASLKCLPDRIDNVDCDATPELCGCPTGELCGCAPGEPCREEDLVGVCVAADRFIDRLEVRGNARGFVNARGCQRPRLVCDQAGNVEQSTCACEDTSRGNRCGARDRCFCRVPDANLIGTHGGSGSPPFDLAVGPMSGEGSVDLVAATGGGIDYLRGGTNDWTWKGQPVGVTDSAHGVVVGRFDEQPNADLAFFARARCKVQADGDRCPIIGGGGGAENGCLGLVLRSGDPDLIRPAVGGCRRHATPFLPDAICAGDLNGDRHVDLALASESSPRIAVYLGDGAGGLSEPPSLIELPAGRSGGPLACADVDEDGVADIVVVSASSRDLLVLRSGP